MTGYSIGIDLAIAGDHVAGVVDEQGHHVRQIRFERTFEGYEKFHRALQQLPTEHGQPWIVLTPTGNAWVPLATYLKAKGDYVLTVSPQQEYDLRQYFNKHAKSDRIDAFVLACVPRVDPDGVHELVLPEALVDSLRRWTREREDLVGQATGCWQRVLAILQQTAPTLAQAWGSSLRTQAGKAFLQRYIDPSTVVSLGLRRLGTFLDRRRGKPLPDDKKQAIFRACESGAAIYAQARAAGQLPFDFEQVQDQVKLELRRLAFEEARIAEVDRRIQRLYDQYDPEHVLTQPAGIEVLSAATLVGASGDTGRFRSLKRYKSFVGLVPRKNESGGQDKKGQKITQRSDPMLRRTYYLIGENARQCDVEAFELYQRLRDRGRHHTQAVVAVGARESGRFLSLRRRYEAYRAGDESVNLTWEFRDAQGQPITKQEARAWIRAEAPKRKQLRERRDRVSGRAGRSLSGSEATPPSHPDTGSPAPSAPKDIKSIGEILHRDPALHRQLVSHPQPDQAKG